MKDLNAKIAEKVMGLEVVRDVYCYLDGEGYYAVDPCQHKSGELRPVYYDGNKDSALEAVPDQEIIKGYPFLCLWSIRNYAQDVAADYQVLRHVRDNWEEGRKDSFGKELESIWSGRSRKAHEDSALVGMWPSVFNLVGQYEVGDYSIAALKVLGEI